MPQDLERRRQVLELFAHIASHALPAFAAARAGLFRLGQVVFDLDPWQMIGQWATSVRVTLLDATRLQLFARFFLDGGFIERRCVDVDAEEQELTRIEPLGTRTVKSAENSVDGRLFLGLHPHSQCFELIRGLLLDAIDEGNFVLK
jgi:hypothetical protein